PSFTVFREPLHDCAVRAARAPTTVLGSVQGVGGSRTTRIVTALPNAYLRPRLSEVVQGVGFDRAAQRQNHVGALDAPEQPGLS
ncbi:MAG: hypothetical protein OXC26_17425, partial [Albidovulum sp.]|nr:hypothetical protein [Albidovulum sp.]